ncbi:DNA ligase (NAD+) [Ferrimonas sediminum]|uniref:DNA ligase n=1 Tax=Ferrimonas sediminum TaxID=718193 RepID=A0A1G8U044_9GAMM|nr:helix-hairpin-helix domain-containing protein [Ferrimonas sediminum]SDJ47158.1 DNA ligase (NAD+) [Ferrimonas sediminum]
MSNFEFNDKQISIINKLNLNVDLNVIETAFGERVFDNLSDDEFVASLKIANALYRAGDPIISDHQYDALISALTNKDPNHPYLTAVEPEVLVESKTVPLPKKMLSTDKAYSFSEIKKWIDRVLKAAEEIQVDSADVLIRVTPKLDGYAAYDDGKTLYTRGDGVRGQDITRAFARGLKVANSAQRGLGPGEIVIKKSYFDDILSQFFENSRNIQAAIIAEKKVDENVQKAIDKGACVFYPFSLIENWTGHYKELQSDFDSIVEQIWNAVDYDVDGVILEVENDKIKEHMGATRKHHRWQIAFKVNAESAEVEVLKIIPQTSRTGRVTPVADLKPTKLSGATISRATVHHYKMVENNGVGPGAVVRLVRSGLVIPKIEEVVKRAEPEIPELCPSCRSSLEWKGDHLVCNNSNCPARKENTLIHFFKTLGNNDGFGPKVIEKLHLFGVDHIHQVYGLSVNQLIRFGFGEKTSQNLIDQLRASREIEVEDWRFLAAFGVNRLGAGNCEKLLQHHSILDLLSLSVDQMISIDGFAKLSAESIVEGLGKIKDEFLRVYGLGFNLAETPKASETNTTDSPIAGKTIVFTGKMIQGSRGDMEKKAKLLGAKPAKSVTGKTDYLVTGEKVGESKIKAAAEKGVQVLTEQQYLDLFLSS